MHFAHQVAATGCTSAAAEQATIHPISTAGPADAVGNEQVDKIARAKAVILGFASAEVLTNLIVSVL